MSLEFQNYGIEQPLMLPLTVPVFLLLLLYLRRPRMTGRRWLLLFSRTLCVFLIAFALATPYMFETKEKYQDTAAVTILSDRSGSMDLFGRDDAQTAENIYQAIRKQVKNNTGFDSTSLKEYSKDSNQTVTGDVLYQNSVEFSKQSNLVILYTDGETNYGRNPQDVADILSRTGTKILTVHPVSPKQEIYIAGITGDKKVPLNSEYPFTVDVGKVGGDAVYDLNVYVDQKEVHTGEVTQTTDLTHVNMTVKFMDKEGPHVLSAVVIPKSSDHFEVNNKYSKIIDVVEKPSILVITSEPNSPLTDILSKNYDVSTATRTPDDLSSYATVYLDNQNASTISDQDIGVLHKYVEDGNGLVVVGGSRSYDSGGYSARPNFESLLPVRSVKEPEKKRKEIAVVLVIDASGSMGDDQSKTQHEKDTAISIIRQLDLKDHVGVVAFNGEAFDVSEMGVLNDHIADIEDKIPRIIFSQGTNVYNGLDRADQMLQDQSYAKYVILLSDGESASSDIENSMAKIKSMKDNGITTFTVGVGYDTETAWMQQYAELGGGDFLDSEQFQNLKMYFQ